MGNKNNKENVTLEALLRIKRNERPSKDFWNSFEHDFERRRLHALVEKDTIRRSFWIPSLKAAMVGLPALLLLSLTAFWSESGFSQKTDFDQGIARSAPSLDIPEFSEDPEAEVQEMTQSEWLADRGDRLINQFVVDAITSEPERALNFRKVLYTPALHLSGATGASYVRDNLSSQNYGVTTAEMKLGRNF